MTFSSARAFSIFVNEQRKYYADQKEVDLQRDGVTPVLNKGSVYTNAVSYPYGFMTSKPRQNRRSLKVILLYD